MTAKMQDKMQDIRNETTMKLDKILAAITANYKVT